MYNLHLQAEVNQTVSCQDLSSSPPRILTVQLFVELVAGVGKAGGLELK